MLGQPYCMVTRHVSVCIILAAQVAPRAYVALADDAGQASRGRVAVVRVAVGFS